MLGRHAQHHGRRQHAARLERLHRLLQVEQRDVVDVGDVRLYQGRVGRPVVEEIRVLIFEDALAELRHLEEGELPV